MKSIAYRHVSPEVPGKGMAVRWVIGRPEGAPNFAMRVIEFEAGVVFEPHQHPYEHEIFVLEGEGTAYGPDGQQVLMRPGVALYIPPDELHGYRNTGNGPLRFICVIPHTP